MTNKKTYAEKASEMKDKLKRTLPDDLAEKLVDQVIDDDIERLIAVFDAFEKYRDEMAEARYRHSMKIIPDLEKKVADLTEMLKALDDSFVWCGCENGYYTSGPYETECPSCLGYLRHLDNSRLLYALAYDVHNLLYPRSYIEHSEPSDD